MELVKKRNLVMLALIAMFFMVSGLHAGSYQVWGGNTNRIDTPGGVDFYLNIDEQDYELLGISYDGRSMSVEGRYEVYVIVTNNDILIDYAGPIPFSPYRLSYSSNVLGSYNDENYGDSSYLDGSPVLMQGGYSSNSFYSFNAIEGGKSWDNFSVITLDEDGFSSEYDYDSSNDYWYGKFTLYDKDYGYYADFGEAYIGQDTVGTTILSYSNDNSDLSLAGSYTDDDGFLVLNDGRMFSGNDTLMHSVGNDWNGELDTMFLLKKMQNPTTDDVIGTYSSYGHWAFPGEWDETNSSMQGTSKFTETKVSANLKFTGGDSEKVSATAWTLNSNDSVIFMPEFPEYFYLAEGGIIFDVDTDIVEDDEESGFDFWVKQSKGKKIADMAGSWVYQEFTSDIHGNRAFRSRGVINIDSKGNYTLDLVFDDADSQVSIKDNNKIKMSSNGNFVMQVTGATNYSGTLNINNDVFAMSVFGNYGLAGLGIGVKVAEYEEPGVLTNDELTVDLEFLSAGTPSQILSGETARVMPKLSITSTNDQVYPRDAEVDLEIYASNLTTDEDFLVYSDTIKLANLKPGASKAVNARFELPETLTTGEYQLTAICQNGSADSDAEDDFTIEYGYTNFDLAISSVNMPTAIVAGEKARGRVGLNLENIGNLPTTKTTESEIKIIARPAAGEDVEVASYTLKCGNLRSGKSKKANVNFEIPSDFPGGTYDLYASVVTPSIGDAEYVTLLPSLDTQIVVAEPYVDLSVEEGVMKSSTVTIKNDRDARLRLPLLLSNLGNVSTGRSEECDIVVYMVDPEDDQAEEILIAAIEDFKAGNLKPGKAKKVNLNCRVPGSTLAGSYNIRVEVDPANDVEESDKTNNTIVFGDEISVVLN